MDDVSAYDVSRANLKLAVDLGQRLNPTVGKVAVMLPDEAERDIAVDTWGGKVPPGEVFFRPYAGIEIHSLRRTELDSDGGGGGGAANEFKRLFAGAFGAKGDVKPVEDVGCYIIIVASAQELPDVEKLHKMNENIPIIFFNMKLDTLRGDLGIPAFPPKDLHDRFLSRVKPIYYLRTRQYSRTKATPPFVINYQVRVASKRTLR